MINAFLGATGAVYLIVAVLIYLWQWDCEDCAQSGVKRFVQWLWIVFFSLMWLPVLIFILIMGGVSGVYHITRDFIKGVADKVTQIKH